MKKRKEIKRNGGNGRNYGDERGGGDEGDKGIGRE